jgi:predicted DNA-binding transcriptional regulator AlpA
MSKAVNRAELARAGIEALGLAREEAAAFVGISPRKFDELVQDGRMPRPKRIDGRLVWSRIRLMAAFEALPDDGKDQVDLDDDWRASV